MRIQAAERTFLCQEDPGMKVVLLRDVPHLGRSGEVKGLAVPATEGLIRHAAETRQAMEQRRIRQLSSARETAARLQGATVTIRAGPARGIGSTAPSPRSRLRRPSPSSWAWKWTAAGSSWISRSAPWGRTR
jgi:hypothetical protein